MLTSMSQLKNGERALIYSLENKKDMRRRLIDIGFGTGTEVVCLGRAPFSDPIAYGIKGSVIALRKADAALITVDREEN